MTPGHWVLARSTLSTLKKYIYIQLQLYKVDLENDQLRNEQEFGADH